MRIYAGVGGFVQLKEIMVDGVVLSITADFLVCVVGFSNTGTKQGDLPSTLYRITYVNENLSSCNESREGVMDVDSLRNQLVQHDYTDDN